MLRHRNGNNSRWAWKEGRGPDQGQAEGPVGSFSGGLAVTEGTAWRAGSQDRLMVVPVNPLQLRSL